MGDISMCRDPSWIKKNEAALKKLFPETWTHAHNIEPLPLMFGLKLLGVEYRTTDEAAQALTLLTKAGIILNDGMLFKRNPHPIP